MTVLMSGITCIQGCDEGSFGMEHPFFQHHHSSVTSQFNGDAPVVWRSAIFIEVPSVHLDLGGRAAIPILGLVEAGGWINLKAQIAERVRRIYTCGSTLVSFQDNRWNPLDWKWFSALRDYFIRILDDGFLVVQRVLTAKDMRPQRWRIIGAAFKMFVPFIVILPGLLAIAVLPIKSHR